MDPTTALLTGTNLLRQTEEAAIIQSAVRLTGIRLKKEAIL